MKHSPHGQVSFGLPIVITLVSSVVGGAFWIGNGFSLLRTESATQDVKIRQLESDQQEIKANVKYIRCLVEQMARKQQITCTEK